ncbi:MAG: FAD-dependent oxidoreductase [Planctomycetaceae bacterium]
MSSIASSEHSSDPVSLRNAPEHASVEHVVVIGNGPVGFRFLSELKAVQRPGQFRITVIGEERTPAYDRVHLSQCFNGKAPSELVYQPVDWYSQQGIDLHLNDPAVAIDRENCTVTTKAAKVFQYDRLFISTGSSPFVPPITGVNLPGVFVYRTLSDVAAIRAFATGCERGVVIGGGLLGLEAAKALSQLGVKAVHIIESSPYLMARQLDNDGSAKLRAHIESLGYNVHTGWMTEEIEANNGDLNVKFRDGTSLSASIIVVATGIRPRDELARACGLEVAGRGGIVVNDRMQTSDSKIYAAGECASHSGIVYGLIAPGFQMAAVAADQMSGRAQKTFAFGDVSTELKLMDITVASLGETLNPRAGYRELVYQDDNVYRKLTLAGMRIIGGMYVGTWEQRHRVRDAISRELLIWPWQIARFIRRGDLWASAESPPVAEWSDDAVVCTCTNTDKGTITQAIDVKSPSVEQVVERTGASSVCGSCHPLIAELCGSQSSKPIRQHSLMAASIVTLVALTFLLFLGPLPVAASVLEESQFDALLMNDQWKQVTGFSLAGIAILASLFSLRKRWSKLTWGDFLTWRALHGWIAAGTVLGLYLHTGFRSGSNLNFVLFASFVSANFLGAISGLVTAGETNFRGGNAATCRTVRPWIVWLHVIGLWPVPVLITFHVIAAYFFS